LELSSNKASQDLLIHTVLDKCGKHIDDVKVEVRASLVAKIQRGVDQVEDEIFFHTAPHHDDIMLGYLAHVVHLVRTPLNQHHFAYLTSGFNAVTNEYLSQQLENALNFIPTKEMEKLQAEKYFEADFKLGSQRDVYDYLDGVAARSRTQKNRGSARRMIRNLLSIYDKDTFESLPERIKEIEHYISNQYPGQKDIPAIQMLKGLIREWEADLVWAHYGIRTDYVHHLRLGFYKGDIFTEEPTVARDVLPILEYLEAIKPTVVTLALDPEASGPDTHYKVMQAIAEAIKLYKQNNPEAKLRVWGYRNVWFRFHPSDANIFVPISLNSMAILRETFKHCFVSQVDAPFPSHEYAGPFSGLAQAIHVEQHQQLKRMLGREFWYNHKHPRLRAAHGVLYIKEMELEEFYTRARELQKVTEEIV
jgi:glucosamine-6-phosphate deaminase